MTSNDSREQKYQVLSSSISVHTPPRFPYTLHWKCRRTEQVRPEPKWLKLTGVLFISKMTESIESCSEPEPEPPRWIVHFLTRRMIEGDSQATTTVSSMCSDYRPEDKTAQQCVEQTLREERAAGWQICTIWVGFFALRQEWNRRRRGR